MALQAAYHKTPLSELEHAGPLGGELPAAAPRSAPKRRLAATVGLLGLGMLAFSPSGRSPTPRSLVAGSVDAVTELAEDPCKDSPFLHMKEILHNNLGGKGPDKGAEGMVFKGADTHPDKPDVDVLLVVNETSGNYVPSRAADNGFHGKYMTLNVKGDPKGTAKAHLKFRVLDAKTYQPRTLKEVDFTFFDLDTATGGRNTEYVMAKGFDESTVTEKTEIKVSKSGEYTVFKASTRGTGSDNPRDPNLLTLQQRDRAVMLRFRDVDHIEAEVGSSAGPHPRYFTFVGRPSLECGKIKGGGDSSLVKSPVGGATTTTTTITTTTATTTEEEKKCLFVIPVVNFCFPKLF